MALTRAGQARDAEADARLAFDYKLPVTPRPTMLYALHFLLDALVELDEPEAAEAALASAGIGDPPGGVLGAPMVLQSRARLRLAQQRPADAHADLIEAAARWDELGCCHPILASWRIEAAEALARLGDSDGARKFAGQQLDLANRLGTPGARGAALRAMARAAPTDQRIPLLQRAVSILSGSPAGLERARALVDLGAALRRANRRGEAREPLSLALDLAQRGGLRLIARRARDELLAAGARPAATCSPSRRRSPRPSTASLPWPRQGTPTGRSPSSSTSRCAPSRRTSPTHSGNFRSPRAPSSPAA
jgi:tetratricopeptide (TPR) repeat protein